MITKAGFMSALACALSLNSCASLDHAPWEKELSKTGVRFASERDVPAMIALIEPFRAELERHQPVFWRRAKDASEKSAPYFAMLLSQTPNFGLIAEQEGRAVGFLIATIIDAPPPFDPGGPTCMIDDFAIATDVNAREVLETIFTRAEAECRARHARQMYVVAVAHDLAKRDMLRRHGLVPVAENWTRPLD